MVKIAIAGGSGPIAREIVDALLATKKHEILILSRKDAPSENNPDIAWAKTDYTDKTELVNILRGVHTILSFVGGYTDPGSVMQKLLIDSAIAAGVKRYAPNEWSSSSIDELPWYGEKGNVREYLKDINKDKKVLEYTLFQPGLITDYVVPLGSSTKHLEPMEVWMDFQHRRAIIIEGKAGSFTMTTMNDLANIVVRAIDYDGKWPVVGGVRGTTLTDAKLLEIGTKARGGKPWDVTRLKEDDVRASIIQASWIPAFKHPDLTAEQIAAFSQVILRGTLLSGLTSSWVVSDDWNQLLPDYKFADTEEFLVKCWAGEP